MSNPLTGEFDLVAQFAIPAVNRFLAAMHQIERFPHSMAFRVDDTPHGRPKPSLVEIVDGFGDTIADQRRIPTPNLAIGDLQGGSNYSRLDGIANVDLLGVNLPPIVPSNLKGRAQVQISPPTIALADAGGTSIQVTMRVMARYFPDPATPSAAEFVRGALQLRASATQIASQVANIVDIDIKADTVAVSFLSDWSSSPLSFEDQAGINLLIRNALKNSFLPSNITLPAGIRVQFRTVTGTHPAVAMLLNMSQVAGNPLTAQNGFLGGGDDFALAAGVDFVRSKFAGTLQQILSQPLAPVHKYGTTYTFTLNDAALNLENGRIVLTIKGQARSPDWWAPNFGFTLRQKFRLVPEGATANLVVAEMSLTTSNTVLNWVKFLLTDTIAGLRDRALADSGAADAVRQALSADEHLGGLLRPLLTAARPKISPPVVQGFTLGYTSVDITPAGIVLHGSLAVSDWAVPHLEFESVSAAGSGAGTVATGPEYSALKSWIPGGVIESYAWHRLGQPAGPVDDQKFVRLPPPLQVSGLGAHPVVVGYAPLCLTVRGTRLSSSGSVVAQPVVATSCGFNTFPLIGDRTAAGKAPPLVALTRPDSDGRISVVGHTRARQADSDRIAPNLVVHFGNSATSGQLNRLAEALGESGRDDAATAIVAVLTQNDLAQAPYTTDVVYSDDRDGAWRRVLGEEPGQSPTTLVVGPKGNVLWRHAGELDTAAVADALRRVLVRTGSVAIESLTAKVRLGHPPPNFVFEYSPGRELTLRKLTGRPVAIVFWKSGLLPSIDAVRSVTDSGVSAGLTVLAVNDGDDADMARKSVEAHRLSATLVIDADRSISGTYGVTAWPTVVAVDRRGVVTAVSNGHVGTGGDGPFQKTSFGGANQGAAAR